MNHRWFAVRHWVTGVVDSLHLRLRRTTVSTQYLSEIDGLRFVAIAAVVCYHINSYITDGLRGTSELAWLQTLLHTGNIGVQLFFAISGFILAVPFLKARFAGGRAVRLSQYYMRRVTRLEPPYLISLLILFVLNYSSTPDPWPHLAWSSVYLHNLVYHQMSWINFVAWSLEIEVQFYVLMPFLAWAFFRGEQPWPRRIALMAICVPFVLWQHQRYGARFPVGITLVDHLQYFVVGILLADVYVNEWRESFDSSAPQRVMFDIVAVLGWLAVPLAILIDRSAARFIVPLAIAFAYVGSLRGHFVRAFLRNRWIAAIGGMCYTIYLFHWTVIDYVFRGLGGVSGLTYVGNLLTRGVVAVLGVLVMSSILFICFEKPFMSLRLSLNGSRSAIRREARSPSQ